MDYASADIAKAAMSEGHMPVLLQFSAEWCDSCRKIAPLIDEIGAVFKKRIRVMTIDVETSADLAQEFGVAAVPSLVMIKEGSIRGKLVGATTRRQVAAFLEDYI